MRPTCTFWFGIIILLALTLSKMMKTVIRWSISIINFRKRLQFFLHSKRVDFKENDFVHHVETKVHESKEITSEHTAIAKKLENFFCQASRSNTKFISICCVCIFYSEIRRNDGWATQIIHILLVFVAKKCKCICAVVAATISTWFALFKWMDFSKESVKTHLLCFGCMTQFCTR